MLAKSGEFKAECDSMKVLWGRMETTRHEIRCRTGVVSGNRGYIGNEFQ